MALLTACGGDNKSSNELTSTVVSGSVGDGPITGATVEIYNVKGELISTETSDSTASYKSSFKVNSRDYPLLLKVSDGIDLVTGDAPDFELVSYMMSKSSSTANINPFSTLIVKMAESMAGGVNAENINYSNAVVMEKFSFGLDPKAINNPVTVRISSKNIAQIVKASEALGEMVRRTRDQISATGRSISGDDVVKAVAADMADGFLDGMGAPGSDPVIAAVANVVTGQVLVEAMTNTLKVNGVIATVVIDQAISIANSSVRSSQMSDSVRITSGLVNQARLSIAAAQVVDSSARLTDLAADIDGISEGTSSVEASRVLSAGASQWLDNAVTMAATADTEVVLSINLVANNLPVPDIEDVTPPIVENASPKITGSPASIVIASSTYSFKPGASDADGDILSFTVANKPAWASFNSSTGHLNGVPAEGDVGDYKNIVITVSDGADTANLTAFNIQVQANTVATGNLDLNWTAPVARADGTALSLADIDGYRIYYGESEGQYTESVEITDGTAQSATVTGVPVGSYHIVMTTYDIEGRESDHSSSVIKSIQ
ncbi:MAG: putative Ig domain-containing protein [Gammaproteobacteria bacterium]